MHIKRHQDNKGIPQGSSISACLANVYMLEIDRLINEFVVARDGIYRRYSDDFIIILPMDTSSTDSIEKIIQKFGAFKDKGILELQPEKTQVYKLQDHSVVNIGHLFTPSLNEKNKTVNFINIIVISITKVPISYINCIPQMVSMEKAIILLI